MFPWRELERCAALQRLPRSPREARRQIPVQGQDHPSTPTEEYYRYRGSIIHPTPQKSIIGTDTSTGAGSSLHPHRRVLYVQISVRGKYYTPPTVQYYRY